MIVSCGCSTVRRTSLQGEVICKCGHSLPQHDFNGRCGGTRWDNSGYEPLTGLYSAEVRKMPDFIEP